MADVRWLLVDWQGPRVEPDPNAQGFEDWVSEDRNFHSDFFVVRWTRNEAGAWVESHTSPRFATFEAAEQDLVARHANFRDDNRVRFTIREVTALEAE